MAPLSPKARAVIESGRDALRPTAAERERMEALLDAYGPVPTAAPLTRFSRFRLALPAAVGVALVGGAAFVLTRATAPTPSVNDHRTAPKLSAPAVVAGPPQSYPSADPEPATSAPAISAPERSAPALAASSQRADSLTQQIALLSRAAKALRGGRASEALQLTNEYQRRFPNGVLGVERRAVRAQALCSLNRVADGRAELANLAQQSPAADRAKQLCDAAAQSAH